MKIHCSRILVSLHLKHFTYNFTDFFTQSARSVSFTHVLLPFYFVCPTPPQRLSASILRDSAGAAEAAGARAMQSG